MPRAGWLAVGAIVGGLLVAEIRASALILVAGSAAVAVVLLIRLARGPRVTAWLGLGLVLVLLRAGLAGWIAPGEAPEADLPRETPPGEERTALVISVGTPSGGLQRAVLELQPPGDPEHVYSWLPRYPQVIPGDRVQVTGRLEPAPNDAGFGEFLARSGIGYTLRSRELERVGADDSPLAALEQLRRTAGALISRSLPEPQVGLAAAFVIGLRDLVARDVAADFRTAGLSHVVAISGWHIAIVAGALGAALSSLSRRRRSVLLIAGIATYAVLAGGSPSVVRAALMAAVVLLARESGRRGGAAAALGLTVLGMLLVEPATVADIGFQLSVAATAGLLCWASPLAEWLRAHMPGRVPGWLLEALAVSLAAQAATLPLVLLHFGRLSLVAPLANLLVAPLVVPVMLAAVLALAAGGLSILGLPALLLAPVALLGGLAVGLMIGIARFAAGLPSASIELPAPLDLAAAALSAGMLLLALRRRRAGPPRTTPLSALLMGERLAAERRSGEQGSREQRAGERLRGARRSRRRTASVAVLSVVALLLALVVTNRPDGRLHLTVLDVGQGDAILIEGPAGGRMLVDTGPDPDRLLALLDERLPAWDRRLDLVAITHPHEDHVAGLALLLDRYRIGAVLEPGMVGPGPGDAAYRRRMTDLGRQTRIVGAGDKLLIDGIRIDVRWPFPGHVPLRAADSGKGINNVSLVLDVRFGERRFLLAGDIEEEIDAQLLASGLSDGRPLDVLKVAHHGSASATTDAFVARLQPRVAIVSAGWDNPYGHPSSATIARLREAGARLFRTDLDGTVQISTDGRTLDAAATGGRPRPATPASVLPPGIGFCPLPAQAGRRPKPGGRRAPYNQAGVDPVARRGRAPPARARPPRLAAAPLLGGGRGSGLPRRACSGERPRRQSAVGRGGGTAP